MGVVEAADEAILHLRSQVLELQVYVRQLEAEKTVQIAGQQLRLARYREVYYEATWIELEFQDEYSLLAIVRSQTVLDNQQTHFF